MPEIPEGTLVDSRYRILSRLGSGGMADVYLAEDQQLGRKLALKLLHRRFAEDPGFVERFRREAQSAAGLQHPNVVSVYDRGEFDGTYYIAMEYLPGRTLKQLIREDAPLEPIRAIDLTIQILKAARFAHRRGVIHRDLKPHNVIVDDSDHAKVTDFGIARAGASDMTETGSIMGTAQYLSPEQAQGHAVSASSDLYSVAVVLYELLTGRVPFDAEAAVTIALKHVSEAPQAVTALNPRVPPELEQVVMWALNKNPGDRPADADQFIRALEQAREAIVAHTRGQRTASIAALSGAAGGAAIAPAAAAAAGAAAAGAQPGPLGGGLGPEGGQGGAARSATGGHPAVARDDTSSGSIPPMVPAPWVADTSDGYGGDDDEHERGSRWRWWALGIVIALLLAGGGVAAYLLTRPDKVLVPTVVKEFLPTARAQLEAAGFQVAVNQQTDSHRSGFVLNQFPLGGAKQDKGSTVTLTVSSGPGNGTVPSVQGETLDQAKQAITKAKLKPGRILEEYSSTFDSGRVIRTDPPAGANPAVGTPITIVVSKGQAPVAVPNVVGQSQSSATAELQSKGFTVNPSTQTSTTVKPGDVISTSPGPGTKVAPGSSVTIVIAQKPTTGTVPDTTGKPRDTAIATLRGAGFKVSVTERTVTNQAQNGIVLSQSPQGGSTAKLKSIVTVVVGKFQTPTTPTTPTTTTPTTPTNTTTTPGG